MYRIAFCLLAMTPAAAAIAQVDLASRIINDPGSPSVTGVKGRLVDDPGVQGGKALRIAVLKKGKNNWDSVVESAITKPVKAGDRLVIMFESRLEKGDGNATTATIPYVAVQQSAAPYSGVISGQVTVGPQWKMNQIEGRSASAYPAGALKATIQVGNAKQTIDLGPIVVLNMGQ
jgi:hypothetical protein